MGLAQLNRPFTYKVDDKMVELEEKRIRERTTARTLFLLRRNIWKRFDRLNESRENM